MATDYIIQRVQDVFAQEGVSPSAGSVERIADEIATGQRTIMDVTQDVRWVHNYLTSNPDANTDPGGHSLIRPDGSGVGGETPTPTQPTRDWRGDAQAMFPWLTSGLLGTFADKWSETGNANLALAYVRQSPEYDRVFDGIRREDGSLRMSENEYFSTKAAYNETLSEFGRDPGDYLGRYGDLFRQDVSAQEFYRAVEGATQRFMEPGAETDNGLVDQYLDAFIGSGSAERALEAVRDSDAYDRVFAGNRRGDGTLIMDEQEYFGYMRGFDRIFLSRGLSPEQFRAHNRHVEALQSELSIQELDSRVTAVEQGVLGNTEDVREYFMSTYGQEGLGFLSGLPDGELRGSALAMAIDPDIGNDLLQRRITASQIGGEAAVQGYARSVERAEELARAGLNQSQARDLYGQAASRLPGLSATTQRFNRGATTLSDFEDATVMGDAAEDNRLTLALREEQSSFSSRFDTRRERDGFGLSGLRQR